MSPNYPHKPIANQLSLCNLLGISEKKLKSITLNSDFYYRLHERRIKEDGSERLIYDVKPELKLIHHAITHKILKKVEYPSYIHGSVKGKDYLSNVSQHIGKKIVISEDISNFFPSLKSKVIHEIWTGFFQFPNETASILTKLVTYNGALVQGCKASSYLANLALWNREDLLFNKFTESNITYTRYVDDVTISSRNYLNTNEVTEAISNIYSMFRSIGVMPNRGKHQLMTNSNNQNVHRINVNSGKASMPRKNRDKIRAAVHLCEKQFTDGEFGSIQYAKKFNSTSGKVNNLKRMHPELAEKLLNRLSKIKPFI